MNAMEKIIALAPKAVEEAERILNRSDSINARIQMIEIVLNRVYGKPEAALRIESGGRPVMEAAEKMQAQIQAMMQAEHEKKENFEEGEG